MIREILRMGDPRLLERAQPVSHFGTRELRQLVSDMRETMAAANGAGLAAPQIGVGLRVVIFGVEHNPRYPDAGPVPYTELVNPVLAPLTTDMEEDWEGCLSIPGFREQVRRPRSVTCSSVTSVGARPMTASLTRWTESRSRARAASAPARVPLRRRASSPPR